MAAGGKGRNCDVLIVGGGPAGLAAAIALRQRGADVLLADALEPPIDKACGEGIMPDSIRELARLGVRITPADGAAFSGICFCDEQSSVSAKFSIGPGVGVRRLALHRLLAERAAEIGVRALWGCPVALRAGQPAMPGSEAVQYRYLIGADGQSSRVRRWADLDAGSLLTKRFGFRVHYRVAPWSSNVEVHWGPKGQAYVTPTGEREVGVSVMTRFSQSTRCSEVIQSIPVLRERLANAAILSKERGAVTTTRRLRHVVRDNVALAGDASGSADAVTGEGLALGFRQALLLAEAMERDDLGVYEDGHPKILRLPQAMARILLLMDREHWLRRRALRALAAEPALFERMLQVHLGEESAGRFLLGHAPKLGLRLLAPFAV